ncbi:MAG: RluA family pseudouridine synthase [Verrucomicrobia bacterium]|jgi:23S rRNA pseudouridine1911/1915/1917 synthase|nr:MAG: RluA family pseudouridine synthase [Verrucomicrobiota bacterium]
MNTSFEITVEHSFRGERLDVFLAQHLPEESRSYLQSLIKQGHVTLQGKKVRCGEKISSGDLIVVQKIQKQALAKAFPEEIPLSVLYEDDDLIIIDKPAGMVVHVATDHEKGTLVNALLHRWNRPEELSTGSESYRPGIVHRLDKETSGCIIVAKNDQTHAALSKGFSERSIKKTYIAIVSGKPRHRKGTITLSIGRHPVQRMKMTERRPPAGREAITDYEVLASTDKESLVACFPHTGRMHQIRVHLQHLGHPIVGDLIYGKRESQIRHLLHAWKIEFIHPRTHMLLQCEAPLPKDFDLVPFST